MASSLSRPGLGRNVADTAGVNAASAVIAGISGIILARCIGPAAKGEYSAIMTWSGVLVIFARAGQSAAVCYHVSRSPSRAADLVATARTLMVFLSVATCLVAILISPILAHGSSFITTGYEIAFISSVLSLLGTSYIASLQAIDMRRWNLVRLVQPLLALVATVVLWRLRRLTLLAALTIVVSTVLMQIIWAYLTCRRLGLAHGRTRVGLIRPLARYGIMQIAASTPGTLNVSLDQLVLSQAVPPANLGFYAVAMTVSMLQVPLVTAIGSAAFPRLAARGSTQAYIVRLQTRAVVGAAILSVVATVATCLSAEWVIPLVFGSAYVRAVPVVWILAPGIAFYACSQVVSDLLRARNRQGIVAGAHVIGALFTITLLSVLVPLAGIYGAAVASTIAYGVVFVVLIVSLCRMWRQRT